MPTWFEPSWHKFRAAELVQLQAAVSSSRDEFPQVLNRQKASKYAESAKGAASIGKLAKYAETARRRRYLEADVGVFAGAFQ